MKNAFLYIVIALDVFFLVPRAQAGIISGTVYKNNQPQKEAEICIEQGQNRLMITTDSNGKYRVFLRQGWYTFKLGKCDSDKSMQVRSYLDSIKNDLYF